MIYLHCHPVWCVCRDILSQFYAKNKLHRLFLIIDHYFFLLVLVLLLLLLVNPRQTAKQRNRFSGNIQPGCRVNMQRCETRLQSNSYQPSEHFTYNDLHIIFSILFFFTSTLSICYLICIWCHYICYFNSTRGAHVID